MAAVRSRPELERLNACAVRVGEHVRASRIVNDHYTVGLGKFLAPFLPYVCRLAISLNTVKYKIVAGLLQHNGVVRESSRGRKLWHTSIEKLECVRNISLEFCKRDWPSRPVWRWDEILLIERDAAPYPYRVVPPNILLRLSSAGECRQSSICAALKKLRLCAGSNCVPPASIRTMRPIRSDRRTARATPTAPAPTIAISACVVPLSGKLSPLHIMLLLTTIH